MSDLPPPLPGEIDLQEWVRSYQEAPPHPPDESTMHVGSRTVPETWYLAAVAERDAALAEAAAWKQRFESAWSDMNRAVAAGPAAEADRMQNERDYALEDLARIREVMDNVDEAAMTAALLEIQTILEEENSP